MRLFSLQTRDDMAGARQSDGDYEYTDRSARPIAGRIRDELELWFSELPKDSRTDVRRRFTSPRRENHLGALVELWTHASLTRHGLQLVVHPDVPSVKTHPDFLAQGRGSEFLVECTTAMPGAAAAGADARRFQAIDALDELRSAEWAVAFSALETGPKALPQKAFRAAVATWLAGLDRTQVRTQTLVERSPFTWTEGAWHIELRPIPLKPGTPELPVVGMSGGGVEIVDTPTRLRSAIETKEKRYGGDPGKPLLLVLVAGVRYASKGNIVDALLGGRVWDLSLVNKSIVERRSPTGAWVGGNGLRGVRVSAVLYTSRFDAWSMHAAQWQLIHHPAPLHRLPAGLVPFASEVLWANGEASETPASQTFHEFFSLSADWPGPDD